MIEMKITPIEGGNNKKIYSVDLSNIFFCISVPNEAQEINMVINLIDTNLLINSNGFNKLNVPNIYNKFNQNNIAVITPVMIVSKNTPIMINQIMEQIKQGNEQYKMIFNRLLSYLINKSYEILKNEGKSVHTEIGIEQNPDYRAFIEEFISKYPSRLKLVNYYDRPKENEPQGNSQDGGGSLANTTTISLDEMSSSDVMGKPKTLVKKPQSSAPGFVSYVLLGVMVAVISLVILYLLL